MKLSISVPDDLWASVQDDERRGPSDVVQRALQLLAEQKRIEAQPMAHAPNQDHLDRYRDAFERAVETTATAFQQAMDNGYRLGLLVAPGMTGHDMDLLDQPGLAADVSRVLESWGDDEASFSFEFAGFVEDVLSSLSSDADQDAGTRAALEDLLGDEGSPAAGVRWEPSEDTDRLMPRFSATFAEGALLAMKDVRNEAARRIKAPRT